MPLTRDILHETKPLSSGSPTTIQIPAFGKIDDLYLVFYDSSGDPVAESDVRGEISNIALKLDGKEIVNCDGNQIYDLLETLGKHVGTQNGVDGVVSLNAMRVMFTDPGVRDIFGWGTNNINSIQLRITAGTLSNIASVQAFTTRTASNENLGAHIRTISYPQSFNSTGEDTVDTLPRDSNANYLAVLTSDGASGTIDSGEVRVNAEQIQDPLPSEVNSQKLNMRGFKQPSGYFVYLFNDNRVDGRLPMNGVTDLRFITDFAVAPGAGGYDMLSVVAYDIPAPTQNNS